MPEALEPRLQSLPRPQLQPTITTAKLFADMRALALSNMEFRSGLSDEAVINLEDVMHVVPYQSDWDALDARARDEFELAVEEYTGDDQPEVYAMGMAALEERLDPENSDTFNLSSSIKTQYAFKAERIYGHGKRAAIGFILSVAVTRDDVEIPLHILKRDLEDEDDKTLLAMAQDGIQTRTMKFSISSISRRLTLCDSVTYATANGRLTSSACTCDETDDEIRDLIERTEGAEAYAEAMADGSDHDEDDDEEGDTMTSPMGIVFTLPSPDELDSPDLERLHRERLEPEEVVELWSHEQNIDPSVGELEHLRPLYFAYGTLTTLKRLLRQRAGL